MQNSQNYSDRDLLLAFSNLGFMSPTRTKRLVETISPLSSISDASPQLLASMLGVSESDARLLRDPLAIPDIRRKVDDDRAAALTLLDDDYPPLLRQLNDPPSVLRVEGDRALLSRPGIAVVGSRAASAYGVNAARLLARQIARAGLVVFSGLARGIDGAAHEEALEVGGATVAILGTGLDLTYPRHHRKLRERIGREGAVATEFVPGTPPHKTNFPVRNRIIAGLSLGVVVVEASARSGSLITARLASEQGREVFAVPGSIFSGRAEGPHRLIQSGAKLLHSIDDLFEELEGIAQAALLPTSPIHSGDAAILLEEIPLEEARHVDWLASQMAWESGRLAAALLELELCGSIRAMPGARYVRCV